MCPLVSIGLPVYNGEATIARVLNRLLDQSFTDLEIVISNNASTDGTNEILEEYLKRDSRIRILNNHYNLGSIFNFNKVFEQSRGKYFMWASHDDFHEKEFVAKCVEAMEMDDKAVLCAPRMQMIMANSREAIWVSSMDSFRKKNSIVRRYFETLQHFPAVSIYGLYRSSALSKTKLLPNVIGGDLIFIQNLSLYGKFIGVPEILFTRVGRQTWNSIHQDYMTFFGKPKKPLWYLPFFIVLKKQIQQLMSAKISSGQRLALLIALCIFTLKEFILKFFLKLLKHVLPEKLKMPIGQFIYWNFMHSPNIVVVNADMFTERIIKPKIGWFD